MTDPKTLDPKTVDPTVKADAKPSMPRPEVDISWKEFTAESAMEMLTANNTQNRPIRQTHIDKLASAMVDGSYNWANPAPIIISNKNVLLDGQHRLYALMQAGVSGKFLVIVNVDPSVYDFVDQNIPRSANDLYSRIVGYDKDENGRTLGASKRLNDTVSAVAKAMLRRFNQTSLPEEYRTSQAKMAEYAAAQSDMILEVLPFFPREGERRVYHSTAAIAAFCNAILHYGPIWGKEPILAMARRYEQQSWLPDATTGNGADPMKLLHQKVASSKAKNTRRQTSLYSLAVSAIRSGLAEEKDWVAHLQETTRDFGEAREWETRIAENLRSIGPVIKAEFTAWREKQVEQEKDAKKKRTRRAS